MHIGITKKLYVSAVQHGTAIEFSCRSCRETSAVTDELLRDSTHVEGYVAMPMPDLDVSDISVTTQPDISVSADAAGKSLLFSNYDAIAFL